MSQKIKKNNTFSFLTSIFQNLMKKKHWIKFIFANKFYQNNLNNWNDKFEQQKNRKKRNDNRNFNFDRSILFSISSSIDCKWCDQNHKIDINNCSHKNKKYYICHKKNHMSSKCSNKNFNDRKNNKNDKNKNETKKFKSQNIDKFKQNSKTFVDQFNQFIKLVATHQKHDNFINFIIDINWLLNFDTEIHCFDDKSLFKNMKFIKNFAQTANDEIVFIFEINDVDVNIDENILTLTNVQYSSNVVTNLINVI